MDRKIVIISDADNIQGRLIEKAVRDFFSQDDIKIFNTNNCDIEYCIGCYTCFYRTPGKCIYNDDMNEILKNMAKADVIFLLSRLKFGCYSPEVKRVLDRIIPLETPFIRIVDGETHFEPRYFHKKVLLAAAYDEIIDVDDALIFSDLVRRNSVNLNADFREPIFFQEAEHVRSKLSRIYGDLK